MSIHQFINNNARRVVVERGIEIYKSGKVILEEYDKDLSIIRCSVEGSNSNYYNIEINFSSADNNYYYTECNCMYAIENHDPCKHQIACLFYLEKNVLEGDYKIVKNNRRNTKDFYTYPNIPDETFFSTVNHNYNDYQSYKINNANIKSRSAIFDVSLKHFYSFEDETVCFKYQDNKLQSNCTCKKIVKPICEHEAAVIYQLLHSNIPDFAFFEDDFIDLNLNTISKNYGISKAEASKNFKFRYNPTSNDFDFVDKNENLWVNDIVINQLEDSINKHFDKSKNSFINNISNFDKYKQFGAGLVITNSFLPEIYPVSAKLDKGKTKMASTFKFYPFSNNNKELTPYLEEYFAVNEIEEKCKKLNSLTKEDEDTDLTVLYELYKDIFDNLKDIKFIYTGKIYKDYKYNGIELRTTAKELSRLKTAEERLKLRLKLIKTDKIYEVKMQVYANSGLTLDINDSNPISFGLIIFNNILYLFDTYKDAYGILEFIDLNNTKIPEAHLKNFISKLIIPLSHQIDIDMSEVNTLSIVKYQAKEPEFNIYLSDYEGFVIFTPEAKYDTISANPLDIHDFYAEGNDNITKIERHNEKEEEFVDFIKSLHPIWKKQYRSDFFHLPINSMTENMWFLDAFEKMKDYGINIYGIDKLKHFKYKPQRANITSHITSGQDWFDVEIKVSFGDTDVKLNEVKKAIKNKSKFIKLSDGTFGILPEEWISKLEKYFRVGDVSKDKIKVSKLKFGILDELFEDIDQEEILNELYEKKKKLKEFTEIKKVRTPKAIKATLRDYQKSGISWLNFLDEFKWGGILADDMGLGKTLQIITFFKQIEKKSKLPNLIIVPTTLIFNWEIEFQKFAPDTEVYFHYGQNREKDVSILKKQNIIITSYGVLVNDSELLHKMKFNYVVLDESQAIKNVSSLRYKAACVLKANNRIACTGTPIENNTFDLFAQFNFLNPGFLGSQKSFKENFSVPIDKEKDNKVAEELQKTINPFVLRRTKEQVIKELPPKTENILYCSMKESQYKVYEAYRNKYRDYLLNKIEEEGLEKSKMFVLEGLLKLRQICDSPALLSDEEDYGNESIKIKELVRNIQNKTGSHKILVFSQFTSMLALIKKELDKEEINYEYLDGSCNKKQRQNSVDNFQSNNDIRVFLISLKAGGTGLNLTAADYVYIVDPWWNPAVENQAIDRCYRIGQDKKVFAYRMICKNTIEEKIMNYQDSKKEIAENIIQTDESIIKKINKNDIISLFS